MTKIRNKFLTATLLLALGGLQAAAAATITTTLGNATPGFADPSTPPVLGAGSIAEAQDASALAGQIAPFIGACGADSTANCDTSWLFSYGALADPILSASLTIGIVDHDSDAGGSQLGSFTLDTFSDLTALLDPQFVASGGGDGMYDVYTIDLTGFFADLTDGSALISLALAGPGLQTCTLPFACPEAVANGETLPFVSETGFNGANLIFSTLTIETRDITIPPVPIPAAAPLFLSAIAAFGLYRRRVLRTVA